MIDGESGLIRRRRIVQHHHVFGPDDVSFNRRTFNCLMHANVNVGNVDSNVILCSFVQDWYEFSSEFRRCLQTGDLDAVNIVLGLRLAAVVVCDMHLRTQAADFFNDDFVGAADNPLRNLAVFDTAVLAELLPEVIPDEFTEEFGHLINVVDDLLRIVVSQFTSGDFN